MRVIGLCALFFLLRIFEVALFPAVASFYIPFSLWYSTLLFALLPARSMVFFAAGTALVESFFHTGDALVFVFLIFFAAVAAGAVRFFFSREGAVGNIFALGGALFVVRILGPAFWLLTASFPGGGVSFLGKWFGMIGWNDIASDALFISVAAYMLIRRERGRRTAARAYV